MVLGLLLILLAGLLNACIVLAPSLAILIANLIFLKILAKLKLKNERFEQLMITGGYIASLLFAASLQVHLWKLLPGVDPWRWTVSELCFVFGTSLMLLIGIFASSAPFDRAWSARRFMIGVILFSGTLGWSYSNLKVFTFVQAAPGQVLRFFIGEVPKEEGPKQ